MSLSLKELPIKAVPFLIFPLASVTFGELYVRVPNNTDVDAIVSKTLATFIVVAGLLFFTKVLFNFPPMKGLEFD